jgi:hypothetical protein
MLTLAGLISLCSTFEMSIGNFPWAMYGISMAIFAALVAHTEK